MYSPWRSKYIASFSEQSSGECILCKVIQEDDDDKNLIVTRGTHSYVILNLYPYNSGHLMVVPFRHIGNLDSLSNEETLEIFYFFKKMTTSLTEIMNPHGFNVGSNIGRCAGAGIDDHIHFHIVPRWNGDTNFMPVLADTKLISEDMNETLMRLRKTIR